MQSIHTNLIDSRTPCVSLTAAAPFSKISITMWKVAGHSDVLTVRVFLPKDEDRRQLRPEPEVLEVAFVTDGL